MRSLLKWVFPNMGLQQEYPIQPESEEYNLINNTNSTEGEVGSKNAS